VQNDICQVMARRLQPVKLAIEHMREPSQWMPVACMAAECPNKAFDSQTGSHVRILGDVLLVVVIKKAVAQ